MRKKFLASALVGLAFLTHAANAQVGIGTPTPHASAQLEVSANNKGVLIPRMTATERGAITTPAAGLLVFQTDATPGFYYNNGTPETPAWLLLQPATNVTTQGNTFNGANQLVQLNAQSQLPAVSGANLTNLNAANLATGTVPAARLGTGTASSTTYLRGDGTWAPAVGSDLSLLSNFANPTSTTTFYFSPEGQSNSPSQTATNLCFPVPFACTIDKLSVAAYRISSAGNNTITITLYKNGVATALTQAVTTTTVGAGTAASNTSTPITLNAGDCIMLQWSQNNATPFDRVSVMVHMK